LEAVVGERGKRERGAGPIVPYGRMETELVRRIGKTQLRRVGITASRR